MALFPHQSIKAQNERERFLIDLFDNLWERYRGRMEYVRKYEELIQAHGASFTNDHIAFRTLAAQRPPAGIFTISRVFEALGYASAGCYEFPDKHFNSIHYQHRAPGFPKLFITQLKTWELPPAARRVMDKSLQAHRPPLGDDVLRALWDLPRVSKKRRAALLKTLTRFFQELPWPLPQKKDVLALNRHTQFGAWVLVNGYDVNHFTALVDSHRVPALDDIEKTAQAMRRAGIPMKKEIEGARGSKLRQTSTEAALIATPVAEGRRKSSMPWAYAYFEIAQRPLLPGRAERFEGFLGGQATRLFEMTRLRKKPK